MSLAADKSVAVYDTADEFYAVLARKKADKFAIMGNPEVADNTAVSVCDPFNLRPVSALLSAVLCSCTVVLRRRCPSGCAPRRTSSWMC